MDNQTVGPTDYQTNRLQLKIIGHTFQRLTYLNYCHSKFCVVLCWEDKFVRESDKGFEIIILIAKDVIYSRLPRTYGNVLDGKQNNTGGGAKHDVDT